MEQGARYPASEVAQKHQDSGSSGIYPQPRPGNRLMVRVFSWEEGAQLPGLCGREKTAARSSICPSPALLTPRWLAKCCPTVGLARSASLDPPPGAWWQWLRPFRAEQMGSSKVLQGEGFIFTVQHHLSVCTERGKQK